MKDMSVGQKRTVLIVEDDLINREILSAILSDNYNVLQAENGKAGLEILEESKKEVSLILLDIQMPVMNGYEFLDRVKLIPSFRSIPIIITTSSNATDDEIKCLENGASDFVSKPYNPDIILRRVGSMIRLREASSVIDRVEHDSITGLYSRDFFFINSEKILSESTQSEYDIFCCEIMSLKMLQDRHSKAKTEKLLIGIAKALEDSFGSDSLYGKLSDSIFSVLTLHKSKENYENISENLRNAVKDMSIPDAVLHFSAYPCVDSGVSVPSLCNRALTALDEVSFQFGRQFAEFNDEFKDKYSRRHAILGYMETAVKENQFEVYYQPKFSLREEKVGGAEALVRWTHPELGFISPGEFIPLFESIGFITELDFYVAERTCRDLREWIDSGKPVVPVSCNLSRADFSHPALAETIVEIADKYSIPHELLHIEVTESAYTDNMKVFLDTVQKLHNAGFRIELDDFGAGYSSLTVLSELDIDILKLDMYFAQNMTTDKQLLILKHIFSIAQRLNIEIVAEGVETKEQSDAFRSMGCDYIQGYYYSKPLPKAQFEEYLRNS